MGTIPTPEERRARFDDDMAVIGILKEKDWSRVDLALEVYRLRSRLAAMQNLLSSGIPTHGDECRDEACLFLHELRAASGPAILAPIPILLFCPECGEQHIDAPEPEAGWTNPPHKSHTCHGCGIIWRPADIATVGVAAIKTRGRADTWSRSDRICWTPLAGSDWRCNRPDGHEGDHTFIEA